MQDILNDIAGTGPARHREFMKQVEGFHARWREHFVRLVFQRARLNDFSDIPRFVFTEETSAAVAGRVAVTMLGLLVPAVALTAVGLLYLRHYPVIG
jgi:hypothetical protein